MTTGTGGSAGSRRRRRGGRRTARTGAGRRARGRSRPVRWYGSAGGPGSGAGGSMGSPRTLTAPRTLTERLPAGVQLVLEDDGGGLAIDPRTIGVALRRATARRPTARAACARARRSASNEDSRSSRIVTGMREARADLRGPRPGARGHRALLARRLDRQADDQLRDVLLATDASQRLGVGVDRRGAADRRQRPGAADPRFGHGEPDPPLRRGRFPGCGSSGGWYRLAAGSRRRARSPSCPREPPASSTPARRTGPATAPGEAASLTGSADGQDDPLLERRDATSPSSARGR